MIRPLGALGGAFALLVIWLGSLIYQCQNNMPAIWASLGESAQRAGLRGLAAQFYLTAALKERKRLPLWERSPVLKQQSLQQIIAYRLAAARVLWAAGLPDAAERVALEACRADYDNIEARALLLEIRLENKNFRAAQQEIMRRLLVQEHPQLIYLLGKSFVMQKRWEEAESCFQRALELKATHFPSLLGMAQIAAACNEKQKLAMWLHKARLAASNIEDWDKIAALEPAEPEKLLFLWEKIQRIWQKHYGSFLYGTAYIFILLSPAFWGLIKEAFAKIVHLKKLRKAFFFSRKSASLKEAN